MKLKPRTEMKFLAIFLATLAILLLIGFACFVHLFLEFCDVSWDRMFRTESTHRHAKIAIEAFVFCILPGMIIVFGGSSWIVFKHLNKISDETPATRQN